jgi:hypothetical protein
VRFHLAGLPSREAYQAIETVLCRVDGVQRVQANPLTGNVLVRFDPRIAGMSEILAALRQQLKSRPRSSSEVPGRSPSSTLFRVGVRGVLGHALVDSLWFGAGFLGQRLGLPLAGLGPLHVLLDVVVWGAALASAKGASHAGRTEGNTSSARKEIYRFALASAKR